MPSNIYTVRAEDLIGEIAGFPIEIVQRMVEHQYAQCNRCRIEIFQSQVNKGHFGGGFTWAQTSEGHDFWSAIIDRKKFDVFFELYPHQKNLVVYVVNGDEPNLRASVYRVFRHSADLSRFAFKAKAGDVYYCDYERFKDYKVRFALAGTSIAKDVIARSEKQTTTDKPKNVDEDSKFNYDRKDRTLRLLKDAISMYSF